jgi:hypothetical protein
MAELRCDKNGTPYLLLSQEESEEERRRKALEPELPQTPEGWVELEEQQIARARAGEDVGPELHSLLPKYDNWHLWVIYRLRQGSMPRRLRHVASSLPLCIGRDDKPDPARVADECCYSIRTVEKHLKELEGMGVDLSRLHEWPHPLQPRQAV